MDKISFFWDNNCFCARTEDMKYKLLAEFYISDKVVITIEFNNVIYEKVEIEQADFRESLLKCIDFLSKGSNKNT